MTLETETSWHKVLKAANCPVCDWTYLISPAVETAVCPHCYRAELDELTAEDLPDFYRPELVIPFNVSDDRITNAIADFSRSFRFSPNDLKTGVLKNRLRKVFIPTWLVDSDVSANWHAEAGFDYQVVSHQESYDVGGWTTEEVRETRIRWEPRVGRLQRSYENLRAPAIDEVAQIDDELGRFDDNESESYKADLIEDTLVRLPNRDQLDAWPDTHPRFKQLAAAECRRASAADHIRQFDWQAVYENQRWGLLLLPVYSTWYLDDDDQPVSVLLNGQNGRLAGLKRASMKKARRATTLLALAASLFFLLTILLLWLEPGLVPLTGLVTVFMALSAILPLVYVSQFNRSHHREMLFSIAKDGGRLDLE
jgi:hypothetical protein